MKFLGTSKLIEYAEAENDELGEALIALVIVFNNLPYLSYNFGEAVKIEIENQLDWLNDHAEIIEEEITQTFKTKKLVFKHTVEKQCLI